MKIPINFMGLFGGRNSQTQMQTQNHGQGPLDPVQIAQPDSDKTLASKIVKRLQSGVSFKQAAGYFEQWAELNRFWEGDQWPTPTPETRNFPRPVTNHFASTIEQKVAALTYEAPELHFVPVETDSATRMPPVGMGGMGGLPGAQPQGGFGMEGFGMGAGMGAEAGAGQSSRIKVISAGPQAMDTNAPRDIDAAEMLSHIAQHQAEKLEFDELLDLGCRTAGLTGTAIWFFPWDNTIVGGGPNSRYIGDIAGYEIDPVDFFPGDPTNRDMQKQPYIIMAERRPRFEVQNFYRPFSGSLVDMLQPEQMRSDTMVYDHLQHEQDDADYVDVIHCWWKEFPGDQVNPLEDDYAPKYSGQARTADLKDEILENFLPGPGTGHPEEEIIAGDMQPDVNLHYAVVCQAYLLRHEEYFYEHGLYPFAAFQWYPRRKSFWGKGEGVDLLPNQKEENRLAGIALLSAYNNGLPNMRYNPEWVNEHDIPKGPGGAVIKDRAPGGNRGIEFIQPPTPASHIPQLRESMVSGMKDASGVHEAWSGKAPSAQLNASAIIALQEAAGVRIRGIQRRFNRAIREIGKLWVAHWKEHYSEDRLFRIAGDGKAEGFAWFNATHYKDMKFDVKVKSGTASPFSKALYIATLDKMYEGGIITPDEYLELQPTDVFTKAAWIQDRREQRQKAAEMKMLQERLMIVETLAAQLTGQAAASGVPITPEVLQQLLAAIEQAEAGLAAAQQQQQGGLQAQGHKLA